MLRDTAVLVPALLLVAGCGSATSPSPRADGPADGSPHGDYVSDGLPAPFDAGDVLRLTFGDGRIDFSAGCNGFGADATWDDGTLEVGGLSATDVGCPGDGNDEDEWLADFVTAHPHISVDGTDVRLASGGDEIWLVPTSEVAPDPGPDVSLEGTTWRLTGIGTRHGDMGTVMVVGRYRATLRIADGEIRFDTTCNDAGGKVKVVRDRLRLRGVATTLVGCLDARGEIEREINRVLRPRWVDWSITGEELRITRGHRTLIYHSR